MSLTEIIQRLLRIAEAPPSFDRLKRDLEEVRSYFGFDTVFLAHAKSPEGDLQVLSECGMEGLADKSLWRLGVEELYGLAQRSPRAFLDITGKPQFTTSGALRLQKPSSGIFAAEFTRSESYLLLGLVHRDAKPYPLPLQEDVGRLWDVWRGPLHQAVWELLKKEESIPSFKRQAAAGRPNPLKAGARASAASPQAPSRHETSQEAFAPAEMPSAAEPSFPKPPPLQRALQLVDGATRLYNDAYFAESLEIEVERARRHKRKVSLILMKVTPAGASKMTSDGLALLMAEVLVRSLRRLDILCRYQEDCFAVILPDTPVETCTLIARRIFRTFKEMMKEEPLALLNLAAGSYPDNSTSAVELRAKTEALLKEAERAGANKALFP